MTYSQPTKVGSFLLLTALILLIGCIPKEIDKENPQLIHLILDRKETIPIIIDGCPKELLNVNGDLFYSNLMGEGVIFAKLEGNIGCVVFDEEKNILINNCDVSVEIDYCFMEVKPDSSPQ